MLLISQQVIILDKTKENIDKEEFIYRKSTNVRMRIVRVNILLKLL